ERVMDGSYMWSTPTARHVAIQAALEADRHGRVRASQAEIAAACGLSRAAVHRALVELEGDALIIKEGHGRYVLCPEWREGLEFGPQRRQSRRERRQATTTAADPDR